MVDGGLVELLLKEERDGEEEEEWCVGLDG